VADAGQGISSKEEEWTSRPEQNHELSDSRDCTRHIQHGSQQVCGPVHAIAKEHSELPLTHIGSQRIPSSTNSANQKATDDQLATACGSDCARQGQS
jgi:hypothetical protein